MVTRFEVRQPPVYGSCGCTSFRQRWLRPLESLPHNGRGPRPLPPPARGGPRPAPDFAQPSGGADRRGVVVAAWRPSFHARRAPDSHLERQHAPGRGGPPARVFQPRGVVETGALPSGPRLKTNCGVERPGATARDPPSPAAS